MTEITRVPLQPLAKGSLSKLWLWVAAALLLAGSFAWAAQPAMINIKTLAAGTGPSPTMDDMVLINYVGKLNDGKVFDSGQRVPMPVSGVIPGFTKALIQMQRGGKYLVKIPAKLGYGAKATGPIPANADLTFEIELLGFMNAQTYQQQMMMMQQQMQRQRAGAPTGNGAGGAAPGAAAPSDGPGAP